MTYESHTPVHHPQTKHAGIASDLCFSRMLRHIADHPACANATKKELVSVACKEAAGMSCKQVLFVISPLLPESSFQSKCLHVQQQAKSLNTC